MLFLHEQKKTEPCLSDLESTSPSCFVEGIEARCRADVKCLGLFFFKNVAPQSQVTIVSLFRSDIFATVHDNDQFKNESITQRSFTFSTIENMFSLFCFSPLRIQSGLGPTTV